MGILTLLGEASVIMAATDTAVSLSTAQLVIAVLSTVGGGGIVVAVINGYLQRRKLGADATEIITKAATGVLENYVADNNRLRVDLDKANQDHKHDMAELRAEMKRMVEANTAQLQIHAAWDHIMVERAREAGWGDVPEPPALYAPEASPAVLLR